jgi:hypothetical protein
VTKIWLIFELQKFFRENFAKRMKSKNATVSQRPQSITEKTKKVSPNF